MQEKNLQEVLKKYEGTVCLVSHDIEFLRNVATTIIATTPPKITKYYGDYDYYLEKTGEKQKRPIITKRSESITNEKKLKRQQRSGIRQKYNTEKKNLEKSVSSFEREIGKLEEEKEKLHQKLIDNPSAVDSPSINRRLKEIDYELSIATDSWENAALKLEEFIEEYKTAMEEVDPQL